MSYREALAAERRLAILEALAEAQPMPLADRVLLRVVEALGAPGGWAELAGDLAWLEAAGCITQLREDGRVLVQLRPLGEDVARGRARLPGVARPRRG